MAVDRPDLGGWADVRKADDTMHRTSTASTPPERRLAARSAAVGVVLGALASILLAGCGESGFDCPLRPATTARVLGGQPYSPPPEDDGPNNDFCRLYWSDQPNEDDNYYQLTYGPSVRNKSLAQMLQERRDYSDTLMTERALPEFGEGAFEEIVKGYGNYSHSVFFMGPDGYPTSIQLDTGRKDLQRPENLYLLVRDVRANQ